MTLPPEVVKLLDEKATPKAAIAQLGLWSDQAWTYGRTLRSESEPIAARKAWINALSAAAIRVCEQMRVCWQLAEATPFDNAAHSDALILSGKLQDEYDAIRDCAKPGETK